MAESEGCARVRPVPAPAAAPIVPDDWSNNGGSHPHSTEVLFDP